MRTLHRGLGALCVSFLVAGCADDPAAVTSAADSGAIVDSGGIRGWAEDAASSAFDAGRLDATPATVDAAAPTVADASAEDGAAADATPIDAEIVPGDAAATLDGSASVADAGSCANGTCCSDVAAPDRCGASCTDFAKDPANCGTCGNACAVFATCSDRACTCADPARRDLCGSACTNRASDRANCGTCGNACAGAETCVAGICRRCTDPGAPNACGNACTNLQSDVANCGTCGNACDTSSGAKCYAGKCLVRYTILGDTWVQDNVTHLIWQRSANPNKLDWNGAKAYCASLPFGPWHLPSQSELLTIANPYPSPSPAIDTAAFPGTPAEFFWTSTLSWDPNYAVTVQFADGGTPTYYIGASWWARCVR